MRKFIVAFAFALPFALPAAPASAQDATPAEVEAARDLLEASRSEENFVRGLELGMEQGGGELTPEVREVLREFMAEHFRYSELEPEFIRIYTDLFTEEELRSFAAFYRTPAGARMAELTAELQAEMQLVTASRMQALMPELTERLMQVMMEEDGQP